MATLTLLDFPLSKITIGDFHWVSTCFELVMKAKEWDVAQQKLVVPMLLCGKLVEYYTEADEGT